MELTLKSDIRSVTQTAEYKGFAISFNYQLETGNEKPLSVSFTGNKSSGTNVDQAMPGSPMSNINFNGSVSKSGKNIFYNGMEEDETITKAIFDQSKTILSTAV